jgi:probable phosphoglycerate mutase
MKTVYFVRHGQTVGNSEKFYQQYDTPLTQVGERGAQAVAERCVELDAEVVISSDMRRAQHTAEIIANRTGLRHIVEPCFHEIMQAEVVRGLSHNDPQVAEYKQSWQHNFYDPQWQPLGAENYEAARSRAEHAAHILESRIENVVLVVSHGDFLMLLTSYLLLQKRGEKEVHRQVCTGMQGMANVGITVFEFDNKTWQLKIYNDHAHFAV